MLLPFLSSLLLRTLLSLTHTCTYISFPFAYVFLRTTTWYIFSCLFYAVLLLASLGMSTVMTTRSVPRIPVILLANVTILPCNAPGARTSAHPRHAFLAWAVLPVWWIAMTMTLVPWTSVEVAPVSIHPSVTTTTSAHRIYAWMECVPMHMSLQCSATMEMSVLRKSVVALAIGHACPCRSSTAVR